jgi:large subunit ribosomal protein L15
MKLAIHTIKPARGSRHSVKKVGRGNASGHGNYSGKGNKGQRSRSGGKSGLKLMGFKRLMQSAPKLRGFKSMANRPAEVYTGVLDKMFVAGDVVNLASLKAKNLVSNTAKSAKVVLSGELKKKLVFEGMKFTGGAKNAVEKSGGEIK